MVVMEKIPQALDIVLCIFCEFIEDCEYNNLSNRILYVLGKEGVSTQFPSKFVRWVFNYVAQTVLTLSKIHLQSCRAGRCACAWGSCDNARAICS